MSNTEENTHKVIDTGDSVIEISSGNTLLVAMVIDDEVWWCGWPEGYTKLSNCELKEKATDEARLQLLKSMAESRDGSSYHVRYARRKLAQLGGRILSPFTPEQVHHLNQWQHLPNVHPFTCGGDRKNANHLDGEGILVATRAGWLCVYCGYAQDWAHAFMADGERQSVS